MYLHGDLEDEEINQLYNHPKVKAMFHLHMERDLVDHC